MAKVRFALLAVAVALGIAAPSVAEEKTGQSQSYVVLIGISNYNDPQIKPRPHAEADAQALYDLYRDSKYLGVPADHIKLLLGKKDPKRPSELATHDNILAAAKWLADSAKKDDLAIFTFIGQGAPLGNQPNTLAYLTEDATLKTRSTKAVAAADLGQAFAKLKSQRFVAMIDVNFRGWTDGPEKLPEPALGLAAYKEFLGEGSKDEDSPSVLGRALFLATSGLRPGIELEKHGLFEHLVLAGLKGAADKEGYEPDGFVTVEELGDYLEKQSPELVQTHAKTDDEKKQFIRVFETRGCHFVLTKNPDVSSKIAEQVKKLEKLHKDGKLSEELFTEGSRLLTRMPKLKAYQDLRKSYQSYVDGKTSPEEFAKDRTSVMASLKLKKSAAFAFATKVMESTRIIRDQYVKETNQGDLVANAIKGLYDALDEKMPAEYKARVKKVKELSEGDLQALLAEVRDSLGQREDLDNHKDLDIALQRMMMKLDAHTTYIDPETLARFHTDTTGNFRGIGIVIHANGPRGLLQVVTPIKGSPAYRKGLKAGDLIEKIIREFDKDGKPIDPPEVISTKGMASSEAVKLIQGKPGTKVKLVIDRKGVDKPLEYEVTRDVVEVETVLGVNRKDNDEWNYYLDPVAKIAYVRVTTFARNTMRDLTRVMKKLEQTGINGLILDLRNNPGGLLTSAVEMSDLFIDDGLIVTIKSRTDRETPYIGRHEGSMLNFPMVCLVDNRSASGSEIVSAALQDHKRAIVMGQRSFGKGSVQTIQPFEGGEIKMTTASFWRPNGKNLNRSSTDGKEEAEWGVTPNKGFVLNLGEREKELLYESQHDSEIIPRRDIPTETKKSEYKDKQLEMSLDYLRSQIKTTTKLAGEKKAG